MTPLQIARTNFILSALRASIGNGQDVWVKWSMMRAFNGAAYRHSTGAVEIYFLDATTPQTSDPSDTVVELGDVRVVVRAIDSTAPPEFGRLIRDADAHFACVPRDPDLVRRLILTIAGQSELDATEDVARFAQRLGCSAQRTHQHLDDLEAELELAVARPQADVRAELALALPGLQGRSLFGAGLLWTDGDGSPQMFRGASFVHAFARQF